MTISRDGDPWDERPYRPLTVEEVTAWKAKRQARCPYDLDKLREWTIEQWLDWGYQLWERDVGDRAIDNVEGLALLMAVRHYEEVLKWCERFGNLIDRKAEENEPANC